ncbi:MAG: CocE/NonD family hydrolase [Synergistaceae bacterium]|jgi:putative CocE/NonD family hydrolase|nr:CocE/NonD family hydrolase [Synergistaceae bacterium]
MRVLRFKLLDHGVHRADLCFSESGITGAFHDRYTGLWSRERSYDPDDDAVPKDFPAHAIYRTVCSFEAGAGSSGEVTLPDGRPYRRFRDAEGTGLSAVLWALMAEAPALDIVTGPGEERTVRGVVWTARQGSVSLCEDGWEWAVPHALWTGGGLPPAGKVRRPFTEYVSMRDGTRLATEIWLPDGPGKHPAVLIRTPYGRGVYGRVMLYLAERGYALVSQDVRGRDDSEGDFIPGVFETDDGSDTLDWLASREWCDGSVGMIGPSYLGKTQWMAAASGHPALKALVSQVCAGGPFTDTPRPGGCFLSGDFAWIFMMSGKRADKKKMERDDWDELLRHRPLRDIPKLALGAAPKFWDEWTSHPDYDDFWRRSDWPARGDDIDVPALMISGWYDDDGMGTAQAWEMNSRRHRAHQRIIYGPWQHSFNTARRINGVTFGPEALRYDMDVTALKWFERFLKGVSNGAESRPVAEYYETGSDRWLASADWPPGTARPYVLYLHSSGQANGSGGCGALSEAEPDAELPDRYVFDPDDPPPQLIDVAENEMAVPGDYREVELRDDVLVYSTPPLEAPLRIAGRIEAVIWAASDASDTDWLVRVTDAAPDGSSIRLADRLIRARYRRSFSEPEPLVPGEAVRYEFRLPPVSHMFKTGHRIRVHVTSGAKNLVFPNPNTGGDVWGETAVRPARQTVYHDAHRASFIILPADTPAPAAQI